ncbi:MAG: hypothetical protein M0R17_03530 [Candidatus Omnitrophica bacterium]|nr:hypothetical protein [Candidatus Omnitrophota bacterium]
MSNSTLITKTIAVTISVDAANPKLCSNCEYIYKLRTSKKGIVIPFCNRFKSELHGTILQLNRCKECLNVFGLTTYSRRYNPSLKL